jgi:4-amino-4-deoxy-L-arabinose transferase-like glycosyltransferase
LGGRFNQAVPLCNSILFALLTAGILLFGLLELTGLLSVAIAAAVIVTALPFGVMMNISQYSDALLGLFLLSAFMCLLLAEKHNNPKLKILSMIFLGLICFTKDEGMILAVIAACLILWQERVHKKNCKNLILTFILAASPMIIFSLALAPHNEAFINGLTSMEKPTNWARLSIILVYPWFEAISGKWNGLWFLVTSGVLLAGKKLWQGTLGVMGISLVLYLGVVLAYYGVNTFFEIGWWLENTLSRILFVLVPTIALWIAFALLP